jgi:16S rRNA (cytosine1402-N4)-methyltransferase
MSFVHITVLKDEVIAAIAPAPGGVYADVTLGGGGHSEAMLDASSPSGVVVGVDRDERALAASRERLARFGDRVRFVHSDFAALPEVLNEAGFGELDGIVADLGVSSPQLDEADRGFSFSRPGPLDMRMDTSSGETALELIERLDDEELADVIYQYGEEHRSRRIAREVKRAASEGRIATTGDLRDVIGLAVGKKRFGSIDPSTKTFQALRIAVNSELEQVDRLLEVAPDLLKEGGVLAIISFHSLEDRRVKYAFRDDPRLLSLTKKPLIASEAELEQNPRSRSAKLRAARRVKVIV